MSIPDLEPWCNSWIVVSRDIGQPVYETWQRSVAEKVNQKRYEVVTAHQWLARINYKF